MLKKNQITLTRQRTALERLSDAINEFNERKDRLELSAILTFLYIAENPGTTKKKIQDALKLAQSSVSRNCTLLSNVQPADGRLGLGLIRTEKDPHELRRDVVMLTAAGNRLAAKLRDIIGE